MNTQAITAALALTGDSTLPAPLGDAQAVVKAINDREPGLSQGGPDCGDLVTRLLAATPATIDTVLAEVVAEYQTRDALLGLRRYGYLGGRLPHMTQAAYEAGVPDLTARLTPTFTTATTALTKAAVRLPAGAAALDAAAVLDLDGARPAWLAASSALDTLLTIAPAYALPDLGPGSRGADLVALLTLPEPADTEKVVGRIKAPSVARRLGEAWLTDRRLTLVDVARGRFAGVGFGLPADHDELLARARAFVELRDTRAVMGY